MKYNLRNDKPEAFLGKSLLRNSLFKVLLKLNTLASNPKFLFDIYIVKYMNEFCRKIAYVSQSPPETEF